MDPIEIALKLKLDEKSLTEAKEQVRQDLRGENVSGMSSGQVAKQLESQRAASTGMPREIASLMKGMSDSVRQQFLARNPQLAEIMASKPGGGGGAGAIPKETRNLLKSSMDVQEKAEKAANKIVRDKAAFMRDMSFLMMPLMNPGSMWGTLFATRQTFGAISNTKMGQGIASRLGMGGIGGAAILTGAVVGAATALGLAFTALKKSVEGAIAAYDNARREYAKALTSGGLPLGFTVRRAALANVLGVSENEVFQFGRQILYLNDKLTWSNAIIAKTTPDVASVGWEFKILGENLKAMFATMAKEAAPAMKQFTEGINTVVKGITKLISLPLFQSFLKYAIAVTPGGEFQIFKGLVGIGKKLGAGVDEGIPPTAYMKQLPVGPWERMGLVVGGMGTAGNPAQQTAKNTAEAVKELKGLRKSLIPRSGGWAFDPAFSNP